jgi:ABC-type phosphate transport system substrate-binding protein
MMTMKIINIAALAALLGLASVPTIASAATANAANDIHANFSTSMVPVSNRFAVPWTGELQLTIHSNGVIQGYYRPADNSSYIPVTGGRDGTRVWLDIGQSGRLHVTGTLQSGRILGGAFDANTNQQYDFTAKLG